MDCKAKNEIKRLSKLINRWNYEYYILNSPTVSDEVYDETFKRLKKLEEKENFRVQNSPTLKIGFFEENSGFPKVLREVPMLSLESISERRELLKFDEKIKKKLKNEKIEYCCEWKIDGLSLSLIYKGGELSTISTRGDGFSGEDVTANKEIIKNIPLFVEYFKGYETIEVRGEVYMEKEEFEKLNKKLLHEKKNFSSARNAASGIMRTIHHSSESKNLKFTAYQMIGSDLKSQSECLRKLNSLGFEVSEHEKIKEISQVLDFVNQRENERTNEKFESDGIVIKVDNEKFHQILGKTSRFPRWAIAYKFRSVSSSSVIRKINTDISRNGRVSYIALVDPIILKGSKINKATLHNFQFIKELKLNIGNEVIIKKAGDVIPQIERNKVESNDYWKPPMLCPSCNSPLFWSDKETYQICKNLSCRSRRINSLSYFVSKSCMNIKGISKKVVEKLYDNGVLSNIADFYDMKNLRSKLVFIEGFKEKSVGKILKGIEISKKSSFDKVLNSLGIPLLSLTKAKKIHEKYHNIGSFLEAMRSEKWEELKKILGEKTQEELKRFFNLEENKLNFKLLEEIFGD